MRQQTEARSSEREAAPPVAFSQVLCAVDGTHASLAGVAQAAALAGEDAHLTLLAVTATGTGSSHFRSAAIGPLRVNKVLDRASRVAEQAGVSCEQVIDSSGPPAAVILERAISYDLLAIGAPMRSALGRFGGAVATATLRSFKTPLLLARPASPAASPMDRVLLASDGRESSERLVAFVSALLGDRAGEILLVHAVGHESRSQPHRIAAQGRLLSEAHAWRMRVLVEPGEAASVILHAAGTERASLIVIGSRRLSGVGAVLGSVSRRVVRALPCTALLLPPERLQSPLP